ncbi:Putative membrane protein [Kitasatospora sp. MMS16-BH015]|uniref:acyltransferase family protein n=1 Tax=Kitasatospora sp. MMS16-BH015 TaxID=2018025 RepID=UPI000CA2B607|nr:acyltransferase [Kitasatospora sp. MMS16-BH015]AUG79178.1 Putative membrane protein [Kitasatospora sp. MMS16-BH015]
MSARKTGRANRLGALDGLRLGAAMMVVAYHYIAFGRGWDKKPEQLFPHTYLPASYGWLGVYLFFLISGFVICLSSWGKPLGHFFTSRVIRLYPAYWFAVLATSLVLFLLPEPYSPLSLSDIGVNLTMLQEPLGVDGVDSVYWTLWVELRFYLVFALVIWHGLTYRRTVIFCCVWATLSVVAMPLDSDWVNMLVLPDQSWYFIAGICFFLMRKFRPSILLWCMVGFSFLMAQHYLLIAHSQAEKHMGRQIPSWPTVVLLALFFLAVAAVALGWLDRIQWRWLTIAGALTYPLYLLHEYIGWNVISRLQHHFRPGPLLFGLVATMLLAAWLVHRFVERPVSTLLRSALARAIEEMRALSSDRPSGTAPGTPSLPGRESDHREPVPHSIEPSRALG